MNFFIKKFIEDNINIIEANEWEHVFLNWYNLAEEVWPDDVVFEEFLEVLTDADLQPDLEARESVLYDEIEWSFQNWMKDTRFNEHKHIGYASMSDSLHSHLGYNHSEINAIIDKVAKSMNLRYTNYYGGGYTWA